ncbi:MAG: hypothetical protein WC468_00305 [Candidatus Paceibacterota bacterium]
MKIKISYTLKILFPIIGWALLCGLFAYVLILSIARFDYPAAKRSFELSAPVFMAVFCFLAVMRYVGFGFWTSEQVRLINKNVSEKGIASSLTTTEVKETFDALRFICRGTLINVIASSLSIVVLLVLTAWINMASDFDLVIIVVGGGVAMFFASAFATFFCQQTMFPAVKECRRILFERGDRVEDKDLSGIGFKFYFLFLLPFFTVLIVLIASLPMKMNVVILSLIGLTMTFVIDRVLFVYLSNSLAEMERFANELPKGEKAVFATGSLDKELVNLAHNLNDASEEINTSRRNLERSEQEMGKRVGELEKFFELTVNREIKMVELKKELGKLKGNVHEDEA